MNKIAIFSAFFCLLTAFYSKPIGTELYILCNNKGDCYYLIGDVHEGKNFEFEDEQQLMLMKYILGKREEVVSKKIGQPDQLDILIEESGELYKKFGNQPCLLSHLSSECKEMGLKYTYCHNIEIRTIYKKAFTIFNPKEDPSRINSDWNECIDGREINVEQLTFKGFFEEFYQLRERLKADQEISQVINQPLFDVLLEKSLSKHDKLLAMLQDRGIGLSSKILDFAKILFREDEPMCDGYRRNMLCFRKKITGMYSSLFQLHIFQKTAAQPCKKKLIIAGCKHIRCLKTLLEANGFYLRNSFGIRQYNFDSIPLQRSELETIISLPSKYQWLLSIINPCFCS